MLLNNSQFIIRTGFRNQFTRGSKQFAFVMSLCVAGCAVNPNTGQSVITLGSPMTWELDITYTHQSDAIAAEMVVILSGLGYTILTINNEPLVILTDFRSVGEPWVAGIQNYRLSISSISDNTFLLKIQPILPLSSRSNPLFADGMKTVFFETIFKPLNDSFIALGWELSKSEMQK